jgi:hypothetical protein
MHSWAESVVTALTSEMPGRLFFWAFCIVSSSIDLDKKKETFIRVFSLWLNVSSWPD